MLHILCISWKCLCICFRSLCSSTCKAYDWKEQEKQDFQSQRHSCKKCWWFCCLIIYVWELMLMFFTKIELQLGNPVLEYATDFNSRAEFFWSHGLISDSTYNMFTRVCNYSRYVSEYNRDSVSSVCSNVMGLVSKETSRFVDKYDVTLDVCISSVLSQSKVISPQPQVSLFSSTLSIVIFFHHIRTMKHIHDTTCWHR